MSLRGSCACKSITYEVAELAGGISHCHCVTCRKTHAAAFNSAAGVKPEAFRWLSGETYLSQFESSPGKVRFFCSKCGTHLLAKKEGRPLWVLRVATLDDDPQVRPEQHIWNSHDVAWLDYEEVPKYLEWQPDRV